MAHSYFHLTAILGSLLIQNAGCSVVFTAQPNFVMYGFPKPLTLGCYFDFEDSEPGDPFPEVTSIFITRGQTKQSQRETVAFITPFESATAKVDLDVIQVTGELSSINNEDQAYLNVEWKSPGEKQAAVYECKIKTSLGTKKATQSISYVVPDDKQLLDKLSTLERESWNKIETLEKYVKTDVMEKMDASEKATLQKIDAVDKCDKKEIVDKIYASEKTTLQKIDAVDRNAKKEIFDKISASEKTTLQKIDEVDRNAKKEIVDKISASEKTTLQKIDAVDRNAKKEIVDKISASEKTILQKIDTIERNAKMEIVEKISASEKATLQKIDTVDRNAQKEIVEKISASEKATLQKIETINNNVNFRVPVIETTLKAVQERHMETGEVRSLRKDFVDINGNVFQVARTIRFQIPYKKAPIVYCSFKTMDLAWDKNARLHCNASQITASSFKLDIETWAYRAVDEARVSWLSYDS